jgi:L-asparagine transporter-like permease
MGISSQTIVWCGPSIVFGFLMMGQTYLLVRIQVFYCQIQLHTRARQDKLPFPFMIFVATEAEH